MKKHTWLFVYILAFSIALCGCSRLALEKTSRLTVYLWDNTLSSTLVPYIESKYPNEDIEFIYGNNNVDLYNYLEKHHDLPDIITTRRFSETDSKPLKSHLLDFSYYNEVSKYYPYALQYYTDTDGSIQWLPVCGIPETMIVNKTLFEQYQIPVPTNYEELVNASNTLYEKGIKPYVSELKMDWAAHSFLQGAAIDQFASMRGLIWRNTAESTVKETTFDDELWHSIFSETNAFIQDMHMQASDANLELEEAKEMFINHQAAMFRATPAVMEQLEEHMDDELVRIPYFSKTSDESWIYTYPSMNIALNKNLKKDSEKLDLAMGVLDVILSSKGQKIIAQGSGRISYMANVKSDVNNLTGIEDEVQKNSFYIRYASNNSFHASLDAIQGLLDKSMDEMLAYETFKNDMNENQSQEKEVVQFKNTYSISADENGCRPAANSILTTIRKEEKADIALAGYKYFTSSIYKGGYTQSELNLMITHNEDALVYTCKLTGKQIRNLLNSYLKENVNSQYKLPIVSGMKYDVNKKDLSLKDISLQDKKTYTVLLTQDMVENGKASPLDDTLSSLWIQSILKNGQPIKPKSYVQVD